MSNDVKSLHDIERAKAEEHSCRITEWLLEAQRAAETAEPQEEEPPAEQRAA